MYFDGNLTAVIKIQRLRYMLAFPECCAHEDCAEAGGCSVMRVQPEVVTLYTSGKAALADQTAE